MKVHRDVSQRKTKLSMYKIPPQGDITFEKFEIESKLATGMTTEAVSSNLLIALRQFGMEMLETDVISHFILRLAYCRTESTRKQFIKLEEIIFRAKFMSCLQEEHREFFDNNGFCFNPVDSQTINNYIKEKKVFVPYEEKIKNDYKIPEFYAVPFEEVLKYVRNRTCFLKNGFVYVSKNQIIEVVLSRFRTHLSHQLALAYKHNQAQNLDDQRIELILSSLSTELPDSKFTSFASGSVSIKDLPRLSRTAFPLCMRNTYDHLIKEKHLKHGARMHFSLFLKGIGLSLEDALIFWKSSFNPRTPPDKFDKQYAYILKHNYGKAGSSISYDPYSCLKIINHIPGAGDHCGCPFKLFGRNRLATELNKTPGLPQQSVSEILNKAGNGDFQVACSLMFRSLHISPNSTSLVNADSNNSQSKVVINHPNGWYEEYMSLNNAEYRSNLNKKADDSKNRARLNIRYDS